MNIFNFESVGTKLFVYNIILFLHHQYLNNWSVAVDRNWIFSISVLRIDELDCGSCEGVNQAWWSRGMWKQKRMKLNLSCASLIYLRRRRLRSAKLIMLLWQKERHIYNWSVITAGAEWRFAGEGCAPLLMRRWNLCIDSAWRARRIITYTHIARASALCCTLLMCLLSSCWWCGKMWSSGPLRRPSQRTPDPPSKSPH